MRKNGWIPPIGIARGRGISFPLFVDIERIESWSIILVTSSAIVCFYVIHKSDAARDGYVIVRVIKATELVLGPIFEKKNV